MHFEDYKGVMVFIQQVDGVITPVSFELIGKGRDLAAELSTDVTAVLIGSEVEGLTQQLAEYGADKIILIDDPALKVYRTEPYAQAMYEAVMKTKPMVTLFGATAIGRDLAPRVSARVHTGLTADCTQLEVEADTKNLLMTRPAFGGNIMATIICPEFRPQMATVRPGVMQKIEPIKGAKANVEKYNLTFTPNDKYVEVLEILKKELSGENIQEAKILVSGGRGMGSKENFKLLYNLAEALDGTVCASRACVDAGWADKEQQVGQTGKTVRPQVYFAVGISGAIQHLAGMEESDIIIAINKDESAPIFDVADVGIVGDLNKILPALTEKIKAMR